MDWTTGPQVVLAATLPLSREGARVVLVREGTLCYGRICTACHRARR
jgi:hypothetical protein